MAEDDPKKAKVNAMWEKMNAGSPPAIPRHKVPAAVQKKKVGHSSEAPAWMLSLGLTPPKPKPKEPKNSSLAEPSQLPGQINGVNLGFVKSTPIEAAVANGARESGAGGIPVNGNGGAILVASADGDVEQKSAQEVDAGQQILAEGSFEQQDISAGAREGGTAEVDKHKNGIKEVLPPPGGHDVGVAARAIAAAALASAKAAMGLAVADDSKIKVSEIRDFAGVKVEVTRYVGASSKEAQELKRKEAETSSSSGLDALLSQIEKKKKLNILDKSRKDWGEYKEEKGVVEELEMHKKSGATYTEKVAFLSQSNLREYELERDQRLAAASRKRSEADHGLTD